MKLYGLIGKKLSHSFSKSFFEKKFLDENIKNSLYELFEIENIEEFKNLIHTFQENLIGLNVTIPYKEKVISFLDEIDYEAHKIGAVNCISFSKNGLSKGYNTDAFAFEESLLTLLNIKNNNTAIVLGNGGASRAVCYVLNKNKIPFHLVHRNGEINFFQKFSSLQSCVLWEDLTEHHLQSNNLIIQTTPLGMHPHENIFPEIHYHTLSEKHILYDLIYNPEETLFLKNGKKYGAITKNGLEMLHLQAEHSWRIWNQIF